MGMYVLKWGGSLRGTLKPLHKRMGLTEKANGFAKSAETMKSLVFAQVIIGLVVATSVCVTFSVVKFVDKKEAENGYKEIPSNAEDNGNGSGCFTGCNVLRIDAAAIDKESIVPLINN